MRTIIREKILWYQIAFWSYLLHSFGHFYFKMRLITSWIIYVTFDSTIFTQISNLLQASSLFSNNFCLLFRHSIFSLAFVRYITKNIIFSFRLFAVVMNSEAVGRSDWLIFSYISLIFSMWNSFMPTVLVLCFELIFRKCLGFLLTDVPWFWLKWKQVGLLLAHNFHRKNRHTFWVIIRLSRV